MDRGLRKSDIIKSLKKHIDSKNNCYMQYRKEILKYLDSYMQKDTITLFKCVPYYDYLLSRLKKLVIKSFNSEIQVVYLIEYFDQYTVMHFSMPIQLDR